MNDKRGLPKGHHTWDIIISLGRGTDGKYKQRWYRFNGTREDAQQYERDLKGDLHHGTLVEPCKMTVGQYLDEWVETAIRPRRGEKTYTQYKRVIKNYLQPALGHLQLHKLSVLHVQRYYAELAPKYGGTEEEGSFADATRMLHHCILSTALKAAVKNRLLKHNVAADVNNKPCLNNPQNDALENVFTAAEAQHFLSVVEEQCSEQWTALFALLLDSGMRRGELLGLQWRDLQDSKIRVERQLVRCGLQEPVFAPPKRGGIRTVDLGDKTLELLREHKRVQSETKMANRTTYKDYGLMFAQSWEHRRGRSVLGAALPAGRVNTKLEEMCDIAKVCRITVHGLRHTCATLMLAAGVPPHVVQRRLGHKRIEMTLNQYAHVLPSQQADAASRLALLLHQDVKAPTA
jgi:integrase